MSMYDPEKTFFTSDTHFGHKLMVVHRGFSTYEQMGLVSSIPADPQVVNRRIDEHDDFYVEQWNKAVPHDGTVFHLGDVALCHPQRAREVLRRLNGDIILIQGSHDKKLLRHLTHRFVCVVDQYILRMPGNGGSMKRDKYQQIVMNHCAFLVWDKSHYGSWNFYGHSHGRLVTEPQKLQIDVGIDVFKKPISYAEAVEIMAPRVQAWEEWRAQNPLNRPTK